MSTNTSTAAEIARPGQYLGFALAGENYAIELLRIREIIEHIPITRVPGMPAAVLNHARHALQALESGAQDARAQVDLFAPPPEAEAVGPTAVEAALAQINPDALSPREALDALYSLQRLLPKK